MQKVFSRSQYLASALALLLTVCTGPPSYASLGQDVSSIQADKAHLNASVRMIPKQLYSVQEMQTPNGSTIRQFVSPAGTVFAVSWQGFSPDLRQLLGDYFDEYMAARSQATHRGRGVHIDNGNLVVETGGHMRYVVGRAFLRDQVPAGVNIDEIR
jgi:Protein of unknown function (DUF2844)